jgi:hypothetical protein
MLLGDILPTATKSTSSGFMLTFLTGQLAEEARKRGCDDIANRIEACFTDLLNTLPKGERGVALMMLYDYAMSDAPPDPPKLRLVHSRPA